MPIPLRVGVAGFWHVHAAEYAALAQAHPETELVAVWDDDQNRRAAGARQFDVEGVGSLEELLARTDGVIVTTATSAHRQVMITIAEAGRHMFAEKVLAPTVDQAEEIIAAADRSGVSVVVSLPRLYHGYTRALSEIVDGERLGRLTYGRVRLCHNGATAGWLPERFFDPEEAVGGALVDLGCHPVYLIQLFLGERPETVSACYRSVTGRGVEDQAVVTLGYPDGAIGVVETGFVSDAGLQHRAVRYPRVSPLLRRWHRAQDPHRYRGGLGAGAVGRPGRLRPVGRSCPLRYQGRRQPCAGGRAHPHDRRCQRRSRQPPYGALLMAAAEVHPTKPEEAATDRIRIGLIGGGAIADAHIRGYRAFAETVLPAAVADAAPEVAQRRAAELGVPAHTDYRQLIAQIELDAVDICLPHHLHANAIVTAAEAGLHVLCEKPLCLTRTEAERVRAAVEQNGVTLMCAHNQLFLPTVAKAMELLAERHPRQALPGSNH